MEDANALVSVSLTLETENTSYVLVLLDDTPGAVLIQMHPVKALSDGILNGLFAEDILLVAHTPIVQFIVPSGLGDGAEVEISVILRHRYHPASADHRPH